MNGHAYQSLWLPERIMQFNLSRLLSSADFITLQSFRWDFMCMWMRSMHKRPISLSELRDYSAHHVIPTLSDDTMVLLHELRHLIPAKRWGMVIAPPPLASANFSPHHNLMAHASSVSAAVQALRNVHSSTSDVEILNWAAASAELAMNCIEIDGNHVRLECAAPLLRLIARSLQR